MSFHLQLARKFKPKVYFHSRERYFPCTVEHYLTYVNMYELQEGSSVPQKDDKVVSSDPLSLLFPDAVDGVYSKRQLTDYIANSERNYMRPKNYIYKNKPNDELLELVDDKYETSFHGNPSLQETPYYILIHTDPSEADAYYISYIFFYAYNGAARLLFDILKVEDHFCDICHVTSRVKKVNGEYTLDNVYYSAHSGGLLYSADEIKTVNNNGINPVVYAARRSHASYNEAGFYFRFGGFGNDETEERYQWFPNNVEIMAIEDVGQGKYQTYYSYLGNMGFKGEYPFIEGQGDTSVGSIGTKRWSGNTGIPETQQKEGNYISVAVWYSLLIITQLFAFLGLGIGMIKGVFYGWRYTGLVLLCLIIVYSMLLTDYEPLSAVLLLTTFFLFVMYLSKRLTLQNMC